MDAATENNTPSQEKSALAKAVNAFFSHLALVVLPYTFGPVGAVLLWAYFALGIRGLEGYKFYLAGFGALVCFGSLAFIFGFMMAALSTLKSVVVYIEDICSEMFDKIRAKMESKVSSMQEGITKQQAEILLKSSIKEVFKTYKETSAKGPAKAVLILILSLCTWLTGKILLGRVKEASGMEITLGLLFANKILIMSAIFFNMRLLLTFLQVCGLAAALGVLALPVLFI